LEEQIGRFFLKIERGIIKKKVVILFDKVSDLFCVH